MKIYSFSSFIYRFPSLQIRIFCSTGPHYIQQSTIPKLLRSPRRNVSRTRYSSTLFLYEMSSSYRRSEGGRRESSTTTQTQVSYKNEPSRREESWREDSRRSTAVLESRHSDSYRQTGYPRVQAIYEEAEKKTVTRDNGTMVPHGRERTITRKQTVTRDGRAVIPYDKEKTITRNDKTVTRRDTRVQTIRDDERAASRTKPSASSSRNSSAPSKPTELERRVERLEDEKTRRLERQVEKLGDQVAQLQMEKGKQRQVYAAPIIYTPAVAYCNCSHCLSGYTCMYY